MRKRFLIVMLLGMIGLATACGSDEPKANSTEEQATERTNILKEDINSIESEYKDYVRDMGIDVDAVLKEAGEEPD